MLKKFTLQAIDREDKISQNGKPYKLLYLTVKESQWKLRLFDRPKITSQWKISDTIELEENETTTTEGKTYKNYKIPNETDELKTSLALIKTILKQHDERLKNLEDGEKSPAQRFQEEVLDKEPELPI